MRHHVFAGLAVLSLGFCCHAFVLAQEDKATENRGKERKSVSNGKAVSAKTFVHKASRSGMEEVRLSKLAEERATNPEVRKFAQHMVKDHSRANKELMAVAEKTGYTLSKSMDAKHKALAEKLSRMEGAGFDRHYMRAQVQDHEEAVALFESYAQNGEDRELKAFAAKTLPTLQEHLRHAQDVAAKVDSGASRSGTRTKTGTGTERQRER